jgi:hypothetical protein
LTAAKLVCHDIRGIAAVATASPGSPMTFAVFAKLVWASAQDNKLAKALTSEVYHFHVSSVA